MPDSKRELFLKRRMRVRAKLKKMAAQNGRPKLSLHKGRQSGVITVVDKRSKSIPNELSAEVLEVSKNGICYAVDEKQRTFAFRLNKLRTYSGEPPSDLGIARGKPITISVQDGDVVSVRRGTSLNVSP